MEKSPSGNRDTEELETSLESGFTPLTRETRPLPEAHVHTQPGPHKPPGNKKARMRDPIKSKDQLL